MRHSHRVGILSALAGLCLLGVRPAPAAPALTKADLFEAGKDGYALYRIPGVVVTAKGSVLAYCEARKSASGDWGTIDLLLRRSTDGGKTWGKRQPLPRVKGPIKKNPAALAQKLGKPTDVTYNNPVAIVDHKTKAIHFLYCIEYMRCFYLRSDDDGQTFSAPVEITATFDKFTPDYAWKVLATGPGHGLQLKSGRLVVPVWLSTGTGGHAHRPSVVSTVYSDDHGKTWKRGEVAAPNTKELINPNETVIAQLADGRVMLNIRSESKKHRRAVTTSKDGATGWTKPEFHDDLLEPICMASLCRLTEKPTHDKNRLLFANPHNLDRAAKKPAPGDSRDRKNLSVKLSYDEGKTWPVNKTLEAGFSGYSDLAVGTDGTILCFYERGSTDGKSGLRTGSLCLARFNLEWLTGGKDALPAPKKKPPVKVDVCVYGGTSGGVAAAVQAARMGKTAVILEPGRHLGGMTSGGLSAVDIGDPRTVGGVAREYFTRLAGRYKKELPWDRKHEGIGTGGAFAVEPHAAEELFEQFVKEAKGVRVLRGARLAATKKDGARLTEVVLEDGQVVAAKMFIDASYEGDLLAKAGVTTVVGREANAKYGETLNGWRISQPPLKKFGPIGANGRDKTGRGAWMRTVALDPYVKPGRPDSGLLPLISPAKMGKPGEAAPGVQAYCYRLCLTDDPKNRRPIDPPKGYDPKRYELLVRYIAACRAEGDKMDMRWFCMPLPLPNKKYDFNTAWLGANLPGAGWGWAEGSWEKRAEIAKAHEDHQRGLLHFLTTDERVPKNIRAEFARFGLPKDEFKDTGGWPHQLYIREARRMVSDFVLTEHHAYGKKVAPRPVALASYGVDAHEAQRIAHGGIVVDEGKLMGHKRLPGPYPIGYGAIVPKAAECDNLFATFCLSASHVCFASTRMEPVLMALSQSAATAACLAIDDGVGVQKVPYEKLRARLLKDKQILVREERPVKSR